MKERLAPVALTLAMLALAAGIVLALRAGASRPLPAGDTPAAVPGRTRFRDLVVVGRARGVRAWEVHAPAIETDRASDRVDFTGGIRATLLQDGRERVRCQAPSARYEAGAGRLSAAGGVVAQVLPPTRADDDDLPPSAGTLTLRTPEIVWSVGARVLDCPRTVDISFGRGEARVDSLRLNLKTRALDCQRFRGRFLVQENDL